MGPLIYLEYVITNVKPFSYVLVELRAHCMFYCHLGITCQIFYFSEKTLGFNREK